MGGIKMTQSALGSLRYKARVPQDVVADRFGVHQTVVSDWERGEYPPSAERMAEMAKMYGVAVGAVEAAVAKDTLSYPKRLLKQRRGQ